MRAISCYDDPAPDVVSGGAVVWRHTAYSALRTGYFYGGAETTITNGGPVCARRLIQLIAAAHSSALV
jgi:hypothetical protein